MIKKLIYILILFIILTNSVQAITKEGSAEYNIYGYKFKKGDNIAFLKNANKNFDLSQTSQTESDKKFYLQEAMRYYFLLSKIDINSIAAHIGLARVYDEMNLDKLAKEHFFLAYDINNKNPELNLRFGDFYYKRQDFRTALPYYKTAYINGYFANPGLNQNLGVIYEKLADIETSKKFYIVAQRLNPQNLELQNKIQLLDAINYSQSQYYLFLKQ